MSIKYKSRFSCRKGQSLRVEIVKDLGQEGPGLKVVKLRF